jgi:hypothetical protein
MSGAELSWCLKRASAFSSAMERMTTTAQGKLEIDVVLGHGNAMTCMPRNGIERLGQVGR